MQDLSLHILDIAENSINAGATKITVYVSESKTNNLLTMEVIDNGRGMDDEMLKYAEDPFHTTRTTRNVGLGIPLLSQSARDCGGNMKISSEKGAGSSISVQFPFDHIDRKPLGDIASSIIVLIAGNPEIDFVFKLQREGENLLIETEALKKEIGDIPITSPDILNIIKDAVINWLQHTNYMIE